MRVNLFSFILFSVLLSVFSCRKDDSDIYVDNGGIGNVNEAEKIVDWIFFNCEEQKLNKEVDLTKTDSVSVLQYNVGYGGLVNMIGVIKNTIVKNGKDSLTEYKKNIAYTFNDFIHQQELNGVIDGQVDYSSVNKDVQFINSLFLNKSKQIVGDSVGIEYVVDGISVQDTVTFSVELIDNTSSKYTGFIEGNNGRFDF